MSFRGRLRARSTALAALSKVTPTGAAAVLVLGTSIAVAAFDSSLSHDGKAGSGTATAAGIGKTTVNVSKTAPPRVQPLTVTSVTPSAGTRGANGTSPVKVTFSANVTAMTAMPRLSPSIPGSWNVSGQTATFTPKTGFPVNTVVTVTVPSGIKAGTAQHPLEVTQASTSRFTTGSYSEMRLEELLAQLGYLPVQFHPAAGTVPAGDAKAQLSAAFQAPAGSFSWKGSYPSQLTSQWRTGQPNELVTGAIDNIEGNQGWAIDGNAGPQIWSYLLSAVAKGEKDPHSYAYVLVTQGSEDENLVLYNDGKVTLTTPVNTGTAAAGGTYDGTFPIFERMPSQVMSGQNPPPSRTTYHDQVYWVSYFHNGEAIHWYGRPSYGWYQSDGCVEVPAGAAETIYNDLTYGTLVTVQGPQA